MRSTLSGTYLERGSVHVGIQLCTHVYTLSLLGSGYMLGTLSRVASNLCGTEWVGWEEPSSVFSGGIGVG